MNDTIEINLKGLDGLLFVLKEKAPIGQLGILGEKDPRSGKGKSNATVGAAHEFGNPARNLPRRSFLRMPLIEHFSEYLDASGLLNLDTLKAVIRDRSLVPWVKKCLIVGEEVVSDAFNTGGFGTWKKWKDPAYENNANQILVDTTQLRDSITSRVK